MVKKNLLGRKVGTGFYRYESAESDGIFEASIDELLNDYRQSDSNQEKDADTIAMQILSRVALEASLIVEEEIVADPRDIDLCIINGLSFPIHHGGVLFWADQIGIDNLNRLLGDDTSELLKKMELEGAGFYG